MNYGLKYGNAAVAWQWECRQFVIHTQESDKSGYLACSILIFRNQYETIVGHQNKVESIDSRIFVREGKQAELAPPWVIYYIGRSWLYRSEFSLLAAMPSVFILSASTTACRALSNPCVECWSCYYRKERTQDFSLVPSSQAVGDSDILSSCDMNDEHAWSLCREIWTSF